MSDSSKKRSGDFLAIADQFQLGVLTTEQSHPVTANLSEVAKENIGEALQQLFQVDLDVLRVYEKLASTDKARRIAEVVTEALLKGGRLFFTGCGSTGRLSIQLVSIWRNFWHRQTPAKEPAGIESAELENRAFAIMAGGDFALIKSVEGFEDFTQFGRKQLGDFGLTSDDVVFAITEGGETSFVIGTAWQAVEAGAKCYFIYNNPDEVLCRHVQRSKEIIQDSRIRKLNLTTGAMAITGSTRMQATSIQLAVLLTILETSVRKLLQQSGSPSSVPEPNEVTPHFSESLVRMHQTLRTPEVTEPLARLVEAEATAYRSGKKTNYFAGALAIDVLTDTTERSPTYCTPAFKKFDDANASDSWAFLFVPARQTPDAWEHIIKRKPHCVEWSQAEVEALVPIEKLQRTIEVLRKISASELMRFKVGLDGLELRPLASGDCATAIISEEEVEDLVEPGGFYYERLSAATKSGAQASLIYFGSESSLERVRAFLQRWDMPCQAVLVSVPETGFLLDGVARVGLKLLLNALSTCTMVALGRVMGNYMVWVVPSNLKLIDRATRYIERLTGLSYRAANELLFEVIEYVEPRMKADQSYPPVVAMAVLRARNGLSNAEAESRLLELAMQQP